MIDGLDSVLTAGGMSALDSYNISVRLLSDQSIMDFDLYTLLIWLIMGMFAFFIYKLIKSIVMAPVKFFRRW